MESSKREEWQEIGRRIGIVRRQYGLSQVEFAHRLCEPLWATEVAEHGMCCADGTLSDPDPCLLDMQYMLREITEVFDVSLKWLLTGEGSGPADAAPDPHETVVYIPMTLSPQYLKDAFARLQLLLDVDTTNPYENTYAKERALRNLLSFLQTEFGSSC